MNRSVRSSLLKSALILLMLFMGFRLFSRPAAPLPEAFADAASLDEAAGRARESGKPVLVFATASWCGPCRALKRGVLKDGEVTRWIRDNTHAVVLDADRDGATLRALRVGALPTLALLRPGETGLREVSRVEGEVTRDALLAWLGEHSGAVADFNAARPKAN